MPTSASSSEIMSNDSIVLFLLCRCFFLLLCLLVDENGFEDNNGVDIGLKQHVCSNRIATIKSMRGLRMRMYSYFSVIIAADATGTKGRLEIVRRREVIVV